MVEGMAPKTELLTLLIFIGFLMVFQHQKSIIQPERHNKSLQENVHGLIPASNKNRIIFIVFHVFEILILVLFGTITRELHKNYKSMETT